MGWKFALIRGWALIGINMVVIYCGALSCAHTRFSGNNDPWEYSDNTGSGPGTRLCVRQGG